MNGNANATGCLLMSVILATGCPEPPGPTTTDGSGTTSSETTNSSTPTSGEPPDPRDFCGSVLQEIPWIESDSVFDPGGLLGSCCDFTKVGDFEAKLIGEAFWPCQIGLTCDDTNPHPFYGICTRPSGPPACGENGVVMCITPIGHMPSCESLGQIAICDINTGEFCDCVEPFPDPPPMCSAEATTIGCPLVCTIQGFLCEPEAQTCCAFAGVDGTTTGGSGTDGGETAGTSEGSTATSGS